ncbi:MAG: hypothetical protein ABL984_14130 [Pyrinomonadaceae bacterium]
MLILLTILLLSAAISAYFYFYRRENSDRLLTDGRSVVDLSHLRPLFMPTDAELLADELETQSRLKAIEAEEVEAEERRRNIEFRDRLDRWNAAPTRSAIFDLLNSVHNDGTLLADAAECVFEEWTNGRVRPISDRTRSIDRESVLAGPRRETNAGCQLPHTAVAVEFARRRRQHITNS